MFDYLGLIWLILLLLFISAKGFSVILTKIFGYHWFFTNSYILSWLSDNKANVRFVGSVCGCIVTIPKYDCEFEGRSFRHAFKKVFKYDLLIQKEEKLGYSLLINKKKKSKLIFTGN